MSVTGLSKMLGALAMIYSLTNSSPMVRMDCSGGVILCAGHWMPGFDASSCAASPASCPSAGTLEGDFQASTDETVDWLAYKYAEYGTHQQDDADIAEKFHDFFEVVTGGAGAAYVTPICGTSTSGSGTEV